MRRVTLRNLVAHKLRLALSAVAVLLGVSFMAGTLVMTDTMRRAFDDLFSNTRGRVDVSVRTRLPFEASAIGPNQARDPVPENLLETVRHIEGVESAQGSVRGYAQLVDKQGKAITATGGASLGISWAESGSPFNIRSGREPRNAVDVVIDVATARRHGFEIGDQIQILLPGPAERFTVVGVAGFGDADNLLGATLAIFDLRTAQRVLGKDGRYDSISIKGTQGVPSDELATRVGSALPEGYEAVTGGQASAEESASIQSVLGYLTTALLVFAGVALFVGAFIISNTFSMIVAQRAREFGLLRAVGASRRQILTSVLVEAAAVGLVASAAGVAVGLGIASGLRAILAGLSIQMPATRTVLLPRTVIVALLVGLTVTVLSALLPARRASCVTPIEAITAGMAHEAPTTRRRLLAGAGTAASGVVLMAIGLLTQAGNRLANVGAGALLVFIAVALLAPTQAGALSRAIGWPASRLRGITGRLARGNAARAPRRTAATASALMIGLALVSFVAVVGSSIKASINETGHAILAELIVQPASALGSGFSPELARRLAATPGVTAVLPLTSGPWRDGQTIRSVTGADPSKLAKLLNLDFLDGDASALGRQGVLVHDNVARARDLKVGDPLRMEYARTGENTLTVAGIYRETQLVGSYIISLDAFEQHFSERWDWTLLLALDGRTLHPRGANDELVSHLIDVFGNQSVIARRALDQTLVEFPNAQAHTRAEFRESQTGELNAILGLVSALLLLAVLIALLGITNTLALSVIERTREFGLLRAVGMSRTQVRAMVRWESLIVAILGALMGVIIGVGFGWAIVSALSGGVIGRVDIPFGQLTAYIVVAGLAGLVAALLPARRAARLDVLAAIATQ